MQAGVEACLAPARAELWGRVAGACVLEVGLGTGLGLASYPAAILA